MRENDIIKNLIKDINRTRLVINKLDHTFQQFKKNELHLLGKSIASAILVSEIFEKFYSSLETIFLKISQFFENSLDKEKWHSDLLNKMIIEISDTRKAVISEDTYKNLYELMKFRHFKRYYLEIDYDWDKLEFLEKKYSRVKPLIEKDLDNFIRFLESLKTVDF